MELPSVEFSIGPMVETSNFKPYITDFWLVKKVEWSKDGKLGSTNGYTYPKLMIG